MKTEKIQNLKDSKVYLIGSGISGLASAVYLLKDAGVLGENIHILEPLANSTSQTSEFVRLPNFSTRSF